MINTQSTWSKAKEHRLHFNLQSHYNTIRHYNKVGEINPYFLNTSIMPSGQKKKLLNHKIAFNVFIHAVWWPKTLQKWIVNRIVAYLWVLSYYYFWKVFFGFWREFLHKNWIFLKFDPRKNTADLSFNRCDERLGVSSSTSVTWLWECHVIKVCSLKGIYIRFNRFVNWQWGCN